LSNNRPLREIYTTAVFTLKFARDTEGYIFYHSEEDKLEKYNARFNDIISETCLCKNALSMPVCNAD